MTPPTIKAIPTAERTVLRVMTSVLLLAIPDSAPSCAGGVVVAPEVVEMAVEVKVSVGIVSVSRISRDHDSGDKVIDVRGSLEAETTTGYILEGKGLVEVGPGAVDVSMAAAVFFAASLIGPQGGGPLWGGCRGSRTSRVSLSIVAGRPLTLRGDAAACINTDKTGGGLDEDRAQKKAYSSSNKKSGQDHWRLNDSKFREGIRSAARGLVEEEVGRTGTKDKK